MKFILVALLLVSSYASADDCTYYNDMGIKHAVEGMAVHDQAADMWNAAIKSEKLCEEVGEVVKTYKKSNSLHKLALTTFDLASFHCTGTMRSNVEHNMRVVNENMALTKKNLKHSEAAKKDCDALSFL